MLSNSADNPSTIFVKGAVFWYVTPCGLVHPSSDGAYASEIFVSTYRGTSVRIPEHYDLCTSPSASNITRHEKCHFLRCDAM
jgi:hypothetical protein